MILFKVLNKQFVKEGASQFQIFLVNFYKVYTLVSRRLSQARLAQVLRSLEDYHRLGYHKFYARWVQKMLKTQRMASALTLLEQYQKDDGGYTHIHQTSQKI
jgi:hypothetical protein